MNVADLHDADLLPIRWRVGGVLLVDMQVGHARLLEALSLWNPRSRDEMLLAVVLQSVDQARARELLGRRRIKWRMEWLRIRTWGNDWAASRKAWSDFVRFNMDRPFWAPVPKGIVKGKTESSTAPINTPILSHLRVALCAECGYDPMRFDEAPMRQVLLDYYATRERAGDVVLATETQATVRAAQQERVRQAAQKAKP